MDASNLSHPTIDDLVNEMSQLTLDEPNFDFPLLPYVCQRRFAEICDGQTLKTFASINSSTRTLSKRCHFVKKVEIRDEELTYTIACYCSKDEFCKDVIDLSSNFNGKFDINENITIFIIKSKEKIWTDKFFDKFPINFKASRQIEFSTFKVNFSVLKNMVNSNQKKFIFNGGVDFDCTLTEFMEFFASLLELDEFVCFFSKVSQLPFNAEEIISHLSSFKSRKAISRWEIKDSYVFIQKLTF